MADLDAAIRARLAIFGNDVQGNAVRAVLDECAACDRDGVLMSPGTVRNLIARELGLSGGTQQAGEQHG